MITTPNFGFKIPERKDNINIDDLTGNFSLLDTKLRTVADITYYVDAVNGNDLNTGLASGTSAFKTIQRAINLLPQIINHAVIIVVATGTYAEGVTIQGFNGTGTLNVQDTNGQVSVQNFSFYNNTIYMYLGGNFLITTNRIAVYRCVFVHIYGISSLFTSTTEYGIYNSASRVYIQYCSVSNKTNAIYTSNMGKTVVQDVGGSGNTNAFLCDYGGETVKKSGNTIVGAVQVYSSGNFQEKTPSSLLASNGYKIYDDGHIEQWGTFSISKLNTEGQKNGTVTMPIPFPTETVFCTANVSLLDNVTTNVHVYHCSAWVNTARNMITVQCQNVVGTTIGTTITVQWFAKGD